jgi:hypothetical protein
MKAPTIPPQQVRARKTRGRGHRRQQNPIPDDPNEGRAESYRDRLWRRYHRVGGGVHAALELGRRQPLEQRREPHDDPRKTEAE